MKTKSIIKEIEKEWKKLIWDKDYPELWDAFEDYLDIGILEAVEKVIRKRVKQLLKEIEKEQKTMLKNLSDYPISTRVNIRSVFVRINQLIREAFKGVIE